MRPQAWGPHDPDLSPARRRPHRPPHAARVHLQRQALRGPRRRHARLRAARQRRRRRRAELEISPAAGHRRLRRGGAQRDRAAGRGRRHGAERARDRGGAPRRPRREQCERVAERRFRRAGVRGSLRALHAGGFLLQDVHVAEIVLDEVRARHPQGVRPGHMPVRAGPRPLRQDERPLRRAGRGRGPRRTRRGAGGGQGRRARHPRRRAGRVRRQPAFASRRRGRRRGPGGRRCDRRRAAHGVGGADGRPAAVDGGGAAPAAQHRVRLPRPQLPDGRRASHRSSAAGRAQGAARAHMARAREAGGAGDGRHGTPARLRQQRPAGRDAGLGRGHVSQPLRCRARQARRRVHQQRQRVSHGAPSCRRGHRGRGGRRRAPCAEGRVARARAQGGHRGDRTRRDRRHPRQAARRRRGRHGARRQGHCCRRSGAHAALRPRGDVRRLEPRRAPPCAIGRPPALRSRQGVLRAGSPGAGRMFRRRRQRQLRAARVPHRRRRRGCRGRAPGRIHRRDRRLDTHRRRRRGGTPRAAVGGAIAARHRARAASSSSTCRTTSPPPTSSWRRARATARSSTSSATRRWASAPTRARPATSTVSRSSRRRRHRIARSAPPPSGRPTRR